MNFLSSGAFWGAVITLVGLSIILKEVFHISFPIIRVIFGVFLLYLGFKVIAGGFGHREKNAVFNNQDIKYSLYQNEYNVIFGSSVIDLSELRSVIEHKKIEVNVVFGNGVLRINDNIPVKVKMSTAFGNVVVPDRNIAAFGESVYESPGYNPKPAAFAY